MRNLLLAIIFLFSLSSQIFSQWIPQNSGTTNRFMTCFFLDDNLGWAAGNLGTIVKTTNGGQNWTSQSISTTDHIHSIFFTDPLNGWLVLYEFVPDRHGVIMHTTNGGETWTTQLTEWWGTLHRVFFTDVNNGYALGSSGLLYKTTNGGQYWSDISPFYDYWLYSAFFFNPNVGWIGGGLEGYLLRTINGGQTWSYIGLPTNERMMSLFFTNENYGWACGAAGKIIRTTNQGLDWLLSNSGVNVELRDIKFINQNEGWSVGLGGKILHSVNGGTNWSQQNSGTNYDLYGVDFADLGTGWAVGDNGTILKYSQNDTLINLVDPNGGEIITAGSSYFILWTSQNVIDVKLEYSTNNGINWISIIDSLPSAGIYDWTVPNTLTSQARVKISDFTDSNIFDVSDGPFTIQSSKVINIVQPNGGEELEGGGIYEIQWSSTDVENVNIQYSINNGASWNIIIDSTQSTGAYIWNVPNILTTQGRVKISDITTPSIYDASDNTFRINYTVDVNDPKYSYNYNLFQNYPNPYNPSTTIRYSIPEESFIKLSVYNSLGEKVTDLEEGEKPAGYYEVNLDASDLPTGIYFYTLSTGKLTATKKMLLLK